LELAIKSAVAIAHNQVLAARDRVELFRKKFIPSQQVIVTQTQELQNLLIVSPFETQRARSAEFAAYADYIKALGDYWVARIQLVREVGAMLPPTFDESGRLDVQALVRRHPPASTDSNNDGS
jgi:cobalt-zinc-cadmium efflux system outer membrane protein